MLNSMCPFSIYKSIIIKKLYRIMCEVYEVLIETEL